MVPGAMVLFVGVKYLQTIIRNISFFLAEKKKKPCLGSKDISYFLILYNEIALYFALAKWIKVNIIIRKLTVLENWMLDRISKC